MDAAEQDEQLASLRAQHAELDEALNTETARPLPDAAMIAEIKKRKLQIKDALAQLESDAH